MNARIKIESIIIALKLFISRLTAHRIEHTHIRRVYMEYVKPGITHHIRTSIGIALCVLQYNGDAYVHNPLFYRQHVIQARVLSILLHKC